VSAAPRHLLLCATPRAAAALSELVEAWRSTSVHVELEPFTGATPDVTALVAEHQRLDAALLVSSARRAPGTVLPASLATRADGMRVPVAWLPFRDTASLRCFAATAARVQRRAGNRRAVALLGQWLPSYLRVADRMRSLVGDGGVRAFRWTGDAITRESMIDALGCGLGLGLYVGHGRPMGWVGYHGVRAHHFHEPAAGTSRRSAREPMGAILSLCCRTASRKRVGMSYAESLPLLGVAAASFGAVSDTLHSDNTRWAVGVCSALAAGAPTVGDLLVRAAPVSPTALQSYRLIGDPLAPLGSDERSVRRAQRVRTYA
jgi:Peptidase family C25